MSKITDTLKLLNPRWEDGKVSGELAKEYKRNFFNKIQDLRKYKQIRILTGLRQVGKTTLKAIKRFTDLQKRVNHNHHKSAFVLKADI